MPGHVVWLHLLSLTTCSTVPSLQVSMENVRVWVAPNGIVLCADQQFSGLMGCSSG